MAERQPAGPTAASSSGSTSPCAATTPGRPNLPRTPRRSAAAAAPAATGPAANPGFGNQATETTLATQTPDQGRYCGDRRRSGGARRRAVAATKLGFDGARCQRRPARVEQVLMDPVDGYGAQSVSGSCNDGKNPAVRRGATFSCNAVVDGRPVRSRWYSRTTPAPTPSIGRAEPSLTADRFQ